MPQKKATTKPHGLDKKKNTDTLACASNTAFIPFGRENAWREIMDKYKKADTNRNQDETRWLKAYKNYRGIYDTCHYIIRI